MRLVCIQNSSLLVYRKSQKVSASYCIPFQHSSGKNQPVGGFRPPPPACLGLTYEIEADDVYKDFWNDKDMFDNSDYPESSPYYCNVNKKIIGKFKDEACGIPITEFIGLKSKMYSYVKDNEKGGKTAKGIKKNIIKNNIKHEDYKNTKK